jgi:hypothetical protein
MGLKVGSSANAPAVQTAIVSAHAIEASRKSRGTLDLSRQNCDCAEVNMNGIRQLLYDQYAVHLLDRRKLDLS